MGNLMKAAEIDRVEAMGRKNMEATLNPQKQAQQNHAARMVTSPVERRRLANPQQRYLLCDAKSV